MLVFHFVVNIAIKFDRVLNLTLFFYCSIPHRYNSFHKELEYAKNIMKNRQDLNMDSVCYAALFGLECFAWFCGGEIIGRGFTFTGYHV
jgi:hypothetical protein